jgi:transposase
MTESPYGKITVEVLHWGAALRGQEHWPHKRISELAFTVRARESLRTVLSWEGEEVEVYDWGVVADALEDAAETIKRLELRIRKLEEESDAVVS